MSIKKYEKYLIKNKKYATIYLIKKLKIFIPAWYVLKGNFRTYKAMDMGADSLNMACMLALDSSKKPMSI